MRLRRRRRPKAHACSEVELVVTIGGQEVMRASLEQLAYAGKYGGPQQLLGDDLPWAVDPTGHVVRVQLRPKVWAGL